MTGIHLSQWIILFLLLNQNIGLSPVAGGCLSGSVVRDLADCSVFSQCDNDGETHTFHCPAGLVFNEEQKVCDWPDNVDCNTGSDIVSETSSTTSSSTVDVTTSQTASVAQTQSTPPSTTPSPSTPPSTTPPPSTSPAPPVPTPTPSPPTKTSSCTTASDEPLSQELRKLRSSTCSISNLEVEEIVAGRASNPTNVKIVESILSQRNFSDIFPKANAVYSYDNFLKAIGKFPSVCSELQICKKTLATMFAHFQQETSGLYYLEEIAKSDYCATWSQWVKSAYPCTPGKQYYGRGSKQLTWNYNYGAFSVAMYGRSSVLLENPELVSDTWLNFASALWFFVTPQPPKPSMLHVIDGTWQPNSADSAAGISPGFGATINVINGGYECGVAGNRQSENREKYYKKYCKTFHLDCHDERTGCTHMGKFSAAGSANPAIYWEPSQNCKLVRWQTAFSGLVEGQHRQCQDSIASQPRILHYYLPAMFSWTMEDYRNIYI